jgi:CO dehydrogenase maturation factor
MAKIAVCGKGGCGKSTVAALLAKAMAKDGYRVLVLDIDESNYGLHRLLGMEMPRDFIDHFGGKAKAGQDLVEYYHDDGRQSFFGRRWKIDDIPREYLSEKDGVLLMIAGKIHEFGEGCACALGTISAYFLANLDLGPRDAVIVDTEAGVEHMGRGVEEGFDHILVVVDPTHESILLSRKIAGIMGNNGCKVSLVLNKVDDDTRGFMLQSVDRARVAAELPADRGLFTASMRGQELPGSCDRMIALVDLVKVGKGPENATACPGT